MLESLVRFCCVAHKDDVKLKKKKIMLIWLYQAVLLGVNVIVLVFSVASSLILCQTASYGGLWLPRSIVYLR